MKTWPLRRRIAVWSTLVSTLALLTFTGVVAINLHREQIEVIDERLATMRQLAFPGSAADTSDATAPLAALLRPPPGTHGDAPLAGFALVRTADRTVVRAEPAKFAQAIADWPPARWPPRNSPLNLTIEKTRLRAAAFPHGEHTLLLAASLDAADESVRDLFAAAALALPFALLLVAAGSWWIARRALAPIAAITRAAASITADRLGERLPTLETADEIGAHVRVLNGMFDRLQRGFEQATRFTADAAHELRTPLTILRGQVEEALRAAPPAQEPLLVGLLEEITGLQKISDTLLLLARFDAGRDPLQCVPLDLSALLAEAIEDAELLAAPHGLAVTAALAPAVRIAGDAVMLRRLALNLLDNAVKFNRPAGAVHLTLRADGAAAVFAVTNTGAGIPASRRATLFERFHRAAADRNRATGGSGLGLSLCREIVAAHGGTLELTRAEEDCTEFSVRLPRLA